MSNSLTTIEEHALPGFDRSIDVMAYAGREPHAGKQFHHSLPPVIITEGKEQPKELIFFKVFPSILRMMIYDYVFESPANCKKINLSKDFATREVFPPDYFLTPKDVLKPIEGALCSGRQMRDDLMTYFWTTYHFHVTFSPFTMGEVFSGMSVKYLNLYARRVNHLTVEVDFTKLGFSAAKNSILLKGSTDKVRLGINALVDGLMTRVGMTVMDDLHLMVRRFEGLRPAADDAEESDKEVPYCPEEALYVFDKFGDLSWTLLKCRMTGFSQKYTDLMMNSLFHPPQYKQATEPAWPDYVPTLPEPTYHSAFNTSSDSAQGTASMDFFTTAGSLGSTQGTPLTAFNIQMPRFGSVRDTPSSPGSITPTASFPSSGAATPRVNPAAILKGNSGVGDESDTGIGLGISLAMSASEGVSEDADSEITRHTAVVMARSDSPLSAPKSPNTMNELNEQDPAFNRAVQAMKMDAEDKEKEKSKKNEGKQGKKKNKRKSKKH